MRPTVEPAVDILRDHGFPLTADQAADGVVGTAQQMASCLTNQKVAAWVTPQGPADAQPQLNPQDFVRVDGGTLYSLSKEGRGTARAVVTAPTVAVVEAAEELAALAAGGRLTTPLLGVLDGAANVCRWRELPNLYSHYGSRGIVLMTILQSWSQGRGGLGRVRHEEAVVRIQLKVYGGGVSEGAFLEDLSRIIGDYDRLSSSTVNGARSPHRVPAAAPRANPRRRRPRGDAQGPRGRPVLRRTTHTDLHPAVDDRPAGGRGTDLTHCPRPAFRTCASRASRCRTSHHRWGCSRHA
ncbi:TraM recognition domain-containing protein [Cellulomonas iranensis]|uniref:TraD/TraG TraM recognition site domain-containing protein n=1 Tax=Cellulomonas iranensis TaxID=76862 RepID=A0ABU0GKC6_9CELL|nr:TraM recognition domain-containing protein [Cellulomonas iranensis]MDQ0425017.1 hypothetical protein [Cellulomonas iranensis]